MVSNLIFDANALCRAGELLDHRGSAPVRLSAGLWLACLSHGRCGVQGGREGPLLLEPGCLLLTSEALVLCPTLPCRLAGVRFAGALADQVAAALDGTVAEDGGRCPGAADALALLASGRAAPSPSFCFDLLCRAARLDEAPPRVAPLAAQAMAAIRKNYASLYGVDELAAALGVSKGHLVRSFKAAAGVTPGRYLTSVRVEAAKQLLRSTDAPLDLVASLAGFSCANYLCRVFKAETGCTPAAWRAAPGPGDGAPALPMDEIYV